MSNDKYVGFDVHLATIVVVVLNAAGKCVMESIIETKAGTIIELQSSDCGLRITNCGLEEQ